MHAWGKSNALLTQKSGPPAVAASLHLPPPRQNSLRREMHHHLFLFTTVGDPCFQIKCIILDEFDILVDYFCDFA